MSSSLNVTNSIEISNEINAINSFLVILSKWIFLAILIFGIICNLFNILVFTRPPLKRNPCCMYFLSSSIAALIYTVINIPLRILQGGYNIDPTATILVVCKFKFFFSYTWRALTVWFLALASIDRFLHSSSNVNTRGWSSYKIAIRVIPLTFPVVHIGYSHVPIFYEIILPRRTCAIGNQSYGICLGIWHLFTYGTGPPLLMFICSLLTIRHVRHRRTTPTNQQGNGNFRRDRNLIRMVFVQCLVVGLTTTAYAIGQWYATLTSNQTKSNLQLARDNLFLNLVGSISAAGHSTTFFVFTLTSQLFRDQLFCLHRQRG